MDMRNTIIRRIAMVAAAAAAAFGALVSCDKPYEMDLPLAVSQHKITLPKEAGSTHIIVYSDGAWTARLGTPVTWGGLNKVSGEGNSDIVFNYSANYGLSRTVNLILAKGELRDTIAINQNGAQTEGSIAFESTAVTMIKSASRVSMPLTTNVPSSVEAARVSVEFFDADGFTSLGTVELGKDVPDTLKVTPWIGLESIERVNKSAVLLYKVEENDTDNIRFARIDVVIPDASGNEFSTRQTIIQSTETAQLQLSETSGSFSGFNGTQTVAATKNNIYPYRLNIAYSTEPADVDWISGIKLTSDGLQFNLAKNESGATRTADIIVSYTGDDGTPVSATYKVSQTAYPNAMSFDDLRAMSAGKISSEKFIEGFVVSDPASANVSQNTQTAQFMFDYTENYRTVYLESTDGTSGVALKFDKKEDNTLNRWEKVRIRINGLTLVKTTDPVMITLTGLTAESILEISGAADEFNVPVKKKTIAQLTDNDIFTLVELQDIEVLCKDGAWTNATNGYCLKDEAAGINPYSGTATAPRWDTAPLLMSDPQGSAIYMLTNSSVLWRQNGSKYGNGTEVVAQGSGTYRGIIVHEDLVRYGDLGRYQVRPMTREEIMLEKPAFSTTIVEWNWNNNVNDMVPEIGTGSANLHGATTTLGADYNSMLWHEIKADGTFQKGQAGLVSNSTVYIDQSWWDFATDTPRFIDFSFSTAGISGSNLILGFTWNHGAMNNTTLDSPAHWDLLYSTDGTTFKAVPGVGILENRSICWWTTTSQDSCPGYKDHICKLPSDCFNQASVTLRFQVHDKVTDTQAANKALSDDSWKTNFGIGKGTLTDKKTKIRFGTITVRYN